MTPSRLIIHCSDTPNGKASITAREIDRWHAARMDISQRDEAALVFAPAYPYCGYHKVIQVGGEVVLTRSEKEKGSHCKGLNSSAIGVCLIGESKYSLAQWEALAWVVEDCERRWGTLQITGHYMHNLAKTCPGFSVEDWLLGDRKPLIDHVL